MAWPLCRAEMWGQSCPTCRGVLQSHSHTTALMGCVFTWGHRAAQSTNVQMKPRCWECREGINPGSHSGWGSAHLYLGEAWDVWPLQLHVSVEGSRQLPSSSWTTAGYCASGMCIVSSGRNITLNGCLFHIWRYFLNGPFEPSKFFIL